MTPRDRLDDLIGGLSASQVMYDYPRNTAGEPMDPVLFVKWDAMLDRLLDAGVTFLDEERLARAMAVVWPVSFRGEFAGDNPARKLLTTYAAAIIAAYKEADHGR